MRVQDNIAVFSGDTRNKVQAMRSMIAGQEGRI